MTDPFEPFAHSSGPREARIAIVGEAWGEEEEKVGRPFQGYSGQELVRMMMQAGIKRKDVFMTNVFALRPLDNRIENLCVGKKEANERFPPLSKGKYIAEQYFPHLDRLRQELEAVAPNLVIALGNTACWALLGSSGIGALRGTVASSTLVQGLKVLPTYHPSAVLRQWAYRPVVLVDLEKAKRESAFPEIRRPPRQILVDPTLDELYEWFYEPSGALRPPKGGYFSTDIETKKGQISMVGFSDHITRAAVIPFWDERQESWSYWCTPEKERLAWKIVFDVLESPYPKLFQNGLYDLQYLAKLGPKIQNVTADTMLLHHSHYPELPKALGFMGSVYTNEPAWKLMRKRPKDEVEKKDE